MKKRNLVFISCYIFLTLFLINIDTVNGATASKQIYSYTGNQYTASITNNTNINLTATPPVNISFLISGCAPYQGCNGEVWWNGGITVSGRATVYFSDGTSQLIYNNSATGYKDNFSSSATYTVPAGKVVTSMYISYSKSASKAYANETCRWGEHGQPYGTGTFTVSINYYTSPVIIQNPNNVEIITGETASFTVQSSSATSYQWYKDDEIIDGATEATYSYTPKYKDTGSKFHCVVTNSYGEATSTKALLTITDSEPPIISNIIKSITSKTNILSTIIIANDTGSGLDDKAYSLDGINWQQANIFNINKNENYTFYVRDKANNISTMELLIDNIVKLNNRTYYIQPNGSLKDEIGKDLKVSFKGTGATSGTVTVNEKNVVVEATMIINGKTVIYENNKVKLDKSEPIISFKNNRLILKDSGVGVRYYAITNNEQIPTDWIKITSTNNIEIDVSLFNLEAGTYYGWCKSASGKISKSVKMVIE